MNVDNAVLLGNNDDGNNTVNDIEDYEMTWQNINDMTLFP